MSLPRILPTLIAATLSVFILAGCSTTIVSTHDIPPDIRASLAVKDVTAKVAQGIEAPSDTGSRLEQAVLKALAVKGGNGKKPATLNLTVVQYNVVSGDTRIAIGAFGGSNRMAVKVDVLDGQAGAVIGRFEVTREANPGGYGAFYDQVQGTIDSTAEGIVAGLFGS